MVSTPATEALDAANAKYDFLEAPGESYMAEPVISVDLHGLFQDEAIKVKRIQPGDNLGITILILREL